MATEIQIANMALNFLGVDQISSLEDNTKTARIVKNVFDTARDAVLQEHDWNFAITRANLAIIAGAPAFEYSFQHQLPTDLLKIVELFPKTLEYQVEEDRLLSHSQVVQLRYVKKVTNSSLYTPMFAQALAMKIAALLAYPLTNSTSLEVQKNGLYIDFLKSCKSADAQQGTPRKLFRDPFIDARY
jgi:hypothetical protein